MVLRDSFERAIENVVAYGDTDIFPFPFENRVVGDSRAAVCDLLESLHKTFFDKQNPSLSSAPPINVSALAPVGYGSYRWATQVDPLWNLYLLGIVIDSFDEIESARVPLAARTVFSYRQGLIAGPGLFREELGWAGFMERSLELATKSEYVVTCDISEFYPRISHHRLENALSRSKPRTDSLPRRVNEILMSFSGSRSVGLPVGGPASRILAELSLNAVDRLLATKGIQFCGSPAAPVGLNWRREERAPRASRRIPVAKARVRTGSEGCAKRGYGRGCSASSVRWWTTSSSSTTARSALSFECTSGEVSGTGARTATVGAVGSMLARALADGAPSMSASS